MKITNKGCKNKHEINTDIFQKKKKTKKENMEGTDIRMSEEDKEKLKECRRSLQQKKNEIMKKKFFLLYILEK